MKKMTMTQQFTATAPDPNGNDYHEDYGLLMSLALDNLLDDTEEQELTTHLSSCNTCTRQWQIWQTIDRQFRMAPMILPPIDFAGAVEARLTGMEQRRRAQVGLLLAILTFTLWALGIAGVGLFLGFLIYNQVGWFGEMLHGLAYSWTALSVIGSSLWGVVLSLGDNPSAVAALVCYIVLAVVSLTGWTHLLRRSIRPLDAQSA